MPSFELTAPDCPPKRLRLLGEDLVAFRDSEGRVGVLKEACPHRGASLFFGRNEESGLRCVYHGWKFDLTGACVDMPSEPAESNFKSKVRAKAYPTQDVNHMVWIYMGPREVPPPFPLFEITTLPAEQVLPPMIMMEEANWFQNLEGDIDSSHIDYLHSRLTPEVIDSLARGFFSRDRSPKLDVVPTDYGAFYSAKRHWDDSGNLWHRITQYIQPIHTMIAASSGDSVSLRSHVPLDDHYSMMISQRAFLHRPATEQERAEAMDAFTDTGGYLPATSDPRTRYFTAANKRNDYKRDYALEKTKQFTGISLIRANLQDRAMTELMTNAEGVEPIYDRSREHLGTTDSMVIMTRRMLIRAARALAEHGVVPANVDNVELDRVRPASIILPPDANWVEATEEARNYAAGKEVAYVVPT
jgi:phenylpropionate dioxygenase-like ring-hydroxylating dioxygenase large terminal subunit